MPRKGLNGVANLKVERGRYSVGVWLSPQRKLGHKRRYRLKRNP